MLATIHAQDAAGAVDALHYLGVPHHIIAGSLRLIIAQNLVRCLCAGCGQPRSPNEQERQLYARLGLELPDNLLQTRGCAECNSDGYKRRMGVFEVVTVDDEIATLIGAGLHQRELCECFRNRAVQSMARDGLKKAAMGATSIDEILRVCGPAIGAGPIRQMPDSTTVAVETR